MLQQRFLLEERFFAEGEDYSSEAQIPRKCRQEQTRNPRIYRQKIPTWFSRQEEKSVYVNFEAEIQPVRDTLPNLTGYIPARSSRRFCQTATQNSEQLMQV